MTSTEIPGLAGAATAAEMSAHAKEYIRNRVIESPGDEIVRLGI